jgi:hypothetical protein
MIKPGVSKQGTALIRPLWTSHLTIIKGLSRVSYVRYESTDYLGEIG